MARRIALPLLLLGLLLPSTAAAATHSNPTPIASPALPGSGMASPYPSTISVAGEAGTVTKVRVTLSKMGGGPVRDFDSLLVGPGGSSLLLSDACSAGGIVPDFAAVDLTFDDDAAAAVPEACAGPPAAGSYKPTNYDTADSFPGIAPPYLLGLSNFRGVSPNGTWQLFVFDDAAPDAVSVAGGWSLELTTTGAPAPPAATTRKKKCKRKKRKAAAAKKKRCKRKKRKSI